MEENDANARSRFLCLCKYYVGDGCAHKKKTCGFLHVCKSFLQGNCDEVVCPLSHNLHDAHNSVVVKKHYIVGNGSAVYQRRSLLPRVCYRYMKSVCKDKYCHAVHVCSGYVQGTCSGSCSLKKSHNLRSRHNLGVLEAYYGKPDQEFFQNLGLIKASILSLSDTHLLHEYLSFSHSPTMLKPVLELFGEEARNILLCNRKKFLVQIKNKNDVNVFAKVDLTLCEKYLSGFCPASNSCSKLHICKAFVLGAKCCKNLGMCKFGFSHDLKAFANNGILLYCSGISHLLIHEILQKLRYSLPFVCKSFATTGSCSAIDCGCLHLCPHFAAGTCSGNCAFATSFAQEQRLLHDLSITRNRFILESAGLSILQQNHDLTFANILYPPEFFRDSVHFLKSAADIATAHVDNADFQASNQLSQKNFLKAGESSVLGDVSADSYLCHHWILGKCAAGLDCHLVHDKSRLPYLWRYRESSNLAKGWSCFAKEVTVSLEMAYCDPHASVVKLEEGTKITVDFESMTGQFLASQTSFQLLRQSTKSSVCMSVTASKAALTNWCWYWLDNDNSWTEYEISGKNASDLIEKDFIDNGEQSNFRFSTSEFSYRIDFVNMIQVNEDERYKTKRKVRRRPVFKSAEELKSGKLGFGIPYHWPKVEVSDGFKLVKATPRDFNLIKKTFIDSIKRAVPNVSIESIEEVCNPAYFVKYQSMKRTMTEKHGEQNVNEKRLYHGIDWKIVKSVCHQNFDWRICGKNATAYGLGCYFATTAQYSHNYCIADDHGVHYMFYADVLTGMCTKGDSSMKRPPPRSGLDLYDSCVDNTSSPAVYIVFERDQCYPRFLVKYKTQKDSDRFSYLESTPSNWGEGAFACVTNHSSSQPSSSNLYTGSSSFTGSQGISAHGNYAAFSQMSSAYSGSTQPSPGAAHIGLASSTYSSSAASGSPSSSWGRDVYVDRSHSPFFDISLSASQSTPSGVSSVQNSSNSSCVIA